MARLSSTAPNGAVAVCARDCFQQSRSRRHGVSRARVQARARRLRLKPRLTCRRPRRRLPALGSRHGRAGGLAFSIEFLR
eukprot:10243007-Alexandrium_andersonii.AAC.1